MGSIIVCYMNDIVNSDRNPSVRLWKILLLRLLVQPFGASHVEHAIESCSVGIKY